MKLVTAYKKAQLLKQFSGWKDRAVAFNTLPEEYTTFSEVMTKFW